MWQRWYAELELSFWISYGNTPSESWVVYFLLKNKIINKEFNKIIGKKSWKLVEFVRDIKWIVNVFVKRGDYANKSRFVNEREGPIIL